MRCVFVFVLCSSELSLIDNGKGPLSVCVSVSISASDLSGAGGAYDSDLISMLSFDNCFSSVNSVDSLRLRLSLSLCDSMGNGTKSEE